MIVGALVVASLASGCTNRTASVDGDQGDETVPMPSSTAGTDGPPPVAPKPPFIEINGPTRIRFQEEGLSLVRITILEDMTVSIDWQRPPGLGANNSGPEWVVATPFGWSPGTETKCSEPGPLVRFMMLTPYSDKSWSDSFEARDWIFVANIDGGGTITIVFDEIPEDQTATTFDVPFAEIGFDHTRWEPEVITAAGPPHITEIDSSYYIERAALFMGAFTQAGTFLGDQHEESSVTANAETCMEHTEDRTTPGTYVALPSAAIIPWAGPLSWHVKISSTVVLGPSAPEARGHILEWPSAT